MSIFKILFSELDDKTNDKLGAYPEKVHVNAMPERRYLKASRVMAFIATGLLCCAIILGFSLYMLAPTLRAAPALMAINKRFYRLDPVERSEVARRANGLLLEEHIKQYIILRHTIVPDVDEMRARWSDESLLRWFSSKRAFSTFMTERELNMSRMMEGLTAEVKIRFVEQITSGLWLAEFEIIEHMPEYESPVIKRYRALLESGFGGEPRPYPNRDERIKNPLDFIVDKYSLSSRALTKDDKNAKFTD